jgi:Rrf2 family transcriptional regulator, nitric oxide-sensitive transcriptional repressor
MPVFFTRENDFAIRICAYLAGKKPDEHVPISVISKKLFITRPFATKIIYKLKTSKIIDTVQGKSGGAFLNVSPENLSLFDILEATGFDSHLNECLKLSAVCPLKKNCEIRSFFDEKENDLINSLKEKKISDFKIYESELKS